MANIVLKSSLYPMRLSMREKRAGELLIRVENRGDKDKLLKLDVQLPDTVAFDKAGINRSIQKRLDIVKANESKEFRLPIFTTPRASPGLHTGRVVVAEHASNYDYEVARVAKELSFRIIV
ncbi:MAG: hypothetical protein V1847_03425 [Candidatus Diapherotrites archaeon]